MSSELEVELVKLPLEFRRGRWLNAGHSMEIVGLAERNFLSIMKMHFCAFFILQRCELLRTERPNQITKNRKLNSVTCRSPDCFSPP